MKKTLLGPGMRTTASALSFAAALAVSGAASANPRPLPYSYPYETLPEGSAEIEQLVDVVPARVLQDDKRPFGLNFRLQTEVEYGITDRLELGLYLVAGQAASGTATALQFDGIKQRLRYRLFDEGVLPIDMALYLETAQLHDEYELEEKVILSKRFGNLKIMSNLWLEQGLERGKSEVEVKFNPTLGLTYQLDPHVWLGVEGWVRGKFEQEPKTPGSSAEFNEKTHAYLGPAISLQWGKLWWSTAAYFRLDNLSRPADVGDKFGRVWVRTMFGLEI